MKTTITTLALFTLLVVACYMADKTGQQVYGLIQAVCILGMGAVLVKKLN